MKPQPQAATSRSSTDAPVQWIRVPSQMQITAADALVRESASGQPSAGRRFLATAREQNISLDHFWMSITPGQDTARNACLLVPGAGHTAMMFISTPRSEFEITEVTTLLEHTGAGAPHPILAQALLDKLDHYCCQAFTQAGYQHLASLLYMRRHWTDIAIDDASLALPEGVVMRTLGQSNDHDLALALQASYENTLDCPELHGLRNIGDVIESHRSTGEYTPSLWWVVYEHDVPHGALLLNPHPAQEGIELVYLGLSPHLRGRDIASKVFCRGVRAIEHRTHKTLACAVDAKNTPARKFYERFGFESFQAREAFVRAYQ